MKKKWKMDEKPKLRSAVRTKYVLHIPAECGWTKGKVRQVWKETVKKMKIPDRMKAWMITHAWV